MDYEVIIIGAGPAGLFAAEKLSSERPGTKILVIDKGKEISERSCPAKKTDKACIGCMLCNISFGVGGAGGLSDGKLNLDHRIGMDINELRISQEKAQKGIDYIDSILVRHGADGNLSATASEEAQEWVERAKKYQVELIPVKQRHMGSDKTPQIIGRFKDELMQRGVSFLVNTEVNNIEKQGLFRIKTQKGEFTSKYLLVAPGRGGAYWFRNQAQKLGIGYSFGEIDVGVRVELDAKVYKPLTDIFYDPKFKLKSPTYRDAVRTFCTNPNGSVTAEVMNNLILVNGHAEKERKTNNTNFALLYTIRLTDPQGDTTSYGRRIADFANFISGQKPVVQRYGDLINGRRSTEESIRNNKVQPTLQGCNPGDIGMALNYRSMINVIETLQILDKILPGVADTSTLIYAPEIKFYDIRYTTSEQLETQLENLYVAGDGTGKSRGIIGAALGGLLAAEGMLTKMR